MQPNDMDHSLGPDHGQSLQSRLQHQWCLHVTADRILNLQPTEMEIVPIEAEKGKQPMLLEKNESTSYVARHQMMRWTLDTSSERIRNSAIPNVMMYPSSSETRLHTIPELEVGQSRTLSG